MAHTGLGGAVISMLRKSAWFGACLLVAGVVALGVVPVAQAACNVDIQGNCYGSCTVNALADCYAKCTVNAVVANCFGSCVLNGVMALCGQGGTCLVNAVLASCASGCGALVNAVASCVSRCTVSVTRCWI